MQRRNQNTVQSIIIFFFCNIAIIGITGAKEKIDYDFQKMLKLIQEVKFIKKTDLLLVNLIKPEAINLSKDAYEINDTEMHAFYLSSAHPKIDLKDQSLVSIRSTNVNYLKKNTIPITTFAPAESYYVAYNAKNKPLFLISIWPGNLLSVSEIVSFSPNVYQNHPGSKIEFNIMVTELFEETIFDDAKKP